MAAPPDDARSQLATLVSVSASGDDGVLLTVRPDEALGELASNRFFMLRRDDGLSPAIPRPFSIYRVTDGGDLVFLLKVIGRGTRALAESAPGTRMRLVGPLGLGWPDFAAPPAGGGEPTPWVFLAGGIGSAPFHMAVEELNRAAGLPDDVCAPVLLYGAATRGLVYELEAFVELDCALHVATDDGSLGFHGNVVQLLEKLLEGGLVPARARLAACGPGPMLRAVAALAERRGLECWVSLEDLMGCGVGICNGCVVETRPDGPRGAWPNAKCCVEGPAFRTDEIVV